MAEPGIQTRSQTAKNVDFFGKNLTELSSTKPNITAPCHHKMPKFDNTTNGLNVCQWMALYDQFTEKSTDTEKINGLIISFVEEPLKWLANELTSERLKGKSWPEVKEAIHQRFKNNVVSDLAKALEIRLDGRGDVSEYYHRKLSLLDSTQLSVEEKIDCLNMGLPERAGWEMKKLRCVTKTLEDWISVASSVWRTTCTATQTSTMANRTRFSRGPVTSRMNNRPPNPCRICINRGRPREFHWHNECPNRTTAHLTESPEEAALNFESDRFGDY